MKDPQEEMRRQDNIAKLYLIALIFSAMALSCAKIEVNPVEETGNIRYQAVVGVATKAGDTEYPKSTPFKTIAYYNGPNDSRKDNSVVWVPESTVSHSGDSSPEGGIWNTPVNYKWPVAGSLTFLAYSPANLRNISMGQDGISITRYNSESTYYKNVDFMVADVQTDKTGNEPNGGYNGVPMIFRHMLTKVRILAMVEGSPTVIIKSVTLNNIYTTANYSGVMSGDSWGSLSHSWRGHSQLRNISIYNAGTGAGIQLDGSEKQIGEAYLAIPQRLTAGQRITVGYTYNGTSETKYMDLDFMHEAWERGKEVQYRLLFGPQKPIRFDGSAEDWTDVSGGGNDGVIVSM